MKILNEIKEYISSCQYILRQIKLYGDKLEFETWIYSGTIKINDTFALKTPELYFEVIKYNILLVGETRYRFSLHNESGKVQYPKNRKLFDVIFAPTIFKACDRKYKKQGKQK